MGQENKGGDMTDKLPQHIAIIPDGTRRWARRRGLPEREGAKAGAETIQRMVADLLERGLKYLTIWGFSTDNWKRPEEQIYFIFEQAQAWIEKDGPRLHSQNARIRHIGRTDRMPLSLKKAINYWADLTRDNTGMTLTAAFDYSGRAEVIDAIRRLIASGTIPDMVNDDVFSHYLFTDGLPDVDLVIRTSGEQRLSNFMIWQAAYSEYYFTPTLWPDFNKLELEKALDSYQQRNRRFGGNA
jgi:undecaprenyl diphosphate synthase